MSTLEIVREPFTYRPDSEHSYFADLIARNRGDHSARERLERHDREVSDEFERRDQLALDGKPRDVEFRVNPNRTGGYGGSFAPPLWLIDRFAGIPRPGRVLADLLPSVPLPQGVQSVSVPRITAGTVAQAAQDGEADPSTDITDTAVTSAVVTIAGHEDVSLELLDQSPPGAHLDTVLFKDLEEAYSANLELQLINGQGSGAGQLLGLSQIVPASNQVTYTSGTPAATAMFGFIGQVVAAVGKNRLRPPETWLMTTARQAWISTSEDSQNRPLLLSGMNGAGEFQLAQYPVELDDAIPRTFGSGSNEEWIFLCRPSDGLLLESAPRTLIDFNSLSGTLQARVQLHRYVAAILGRYPSGIAVLRGTGMVPPTGF